MRKITKEELRAMIREEFKNALDPAKKNVKELPWWKAEPENETDWMKAVKIKELFMKAGDDE